MSKLSIISTYFNIAAQTMPYFWHNIARLTVIKALMSFAF